MRNTLILCLGLMLAQHCSAQSVQAADSPPTDTLLFEGGVELIDLYHALPGASPSSSNPKLVDALAAARNGEFRLAALRANSQKNAFERRDEASLIAEKFKQSQFTTSGMKFVAVVADVTVEPDAIRERSVRICWERTCHHDYPLLEERVANYILRISLPSGHGIVIEPDEAAARELEAEASSNPMRILHATYIAEIEGADPIQTLDGLPFLQVRARLVKLRIARGNPLDDEATPESIFHSPYIFEATF